MAKTKAPKKGGKRTQHKRTKKHSPLMWVVIGIVVAIAVVTFLFLRNNRLNISEEVRLYIPTGSSYEAVCDTLTVHNCMPNKMLFATLAKLRSYPSHVKSGSYVVEPGTNVVALFMKLYRGNQDALRITIGKYRLVGDLCAYLGNKLEFSSDSLECLLKDSEVCAAYGHTPASILGLFPKNTYECYWNISPRRFLDKMLTESNRFWNEKRLSQCEKLGMTPNEVLTLASIVDEETNQNDEKDLVASVYLNRLKKGMLLQADPTLKYAAGDFTLRRILNKHMEIESPYNTYKYKGLPPGPICIPATSSIDAVLANRQTSYLYFCAKEDFSGHHNFATTLSEHNHNAAKFHAVLNERKIYK